LFRHPSFWAEEGSETLPVHIIESPTVIQTEQLVHDSLAVQCTPFVASLDEATVNVGCFATLDCPSKGPTFRRLLADTTSPPTGGYGSPKISHRQISD
jgi:hypothetical protein